MAEELFDDMATGFFEGEGKSFAEALEDASNKAKNSRKGWYQVHKTQVDVADSIHDYKVLIGP